MPKWQEDLIAQIVASLKRKYVAADKYEDKINEDLLTSALTSAFTAQFSETEEPNDPENGKKFALAVTKMLIDITKDEHFFIEYDPMALRLGVCVSN